MERDIINQSAIAARGPSFCGADNQEVGQYELCRHQSMGINNPGGGGGCDCRGCCGGRVCVSGARQAVLLWWTAYAITCALERRGKRCCVLF